MVKARALRKRYISFEVKTSDSFTEEEFKHALYKEALKFFGEYLLSFVALKLISYDGAKKIATIRCNRDFVNETLGFLALISSLNGKKARTIALGTSGTIKALGKKLTTTPNPL
jgi:RNase P/RNase MRP subunit POP5